MLVPLSLLFIAFGVPSSAQSVEYTPYQYEPGRAILLNCSVQDAGTGDLTYTWKKNGTDIEHVEELKARYETLEGGAVLRVKPRTRDEDSGDYACYAGEGVRAWRVRPLPIAKLPPEVNVIEGETLTVNCKLVSKPYVPVQWLHETQAVEAGSRVTLRENYWGVPSGELVVEGVTRADAGGYSCVPPGGRAAYTTVHVQPRN